MKNNHFLLNIVTIILLSGYSIIGYSQPVTWVKTFGDSVLDMDGASITQTFDGGYALIAYRGNVNARLVMMKLDSLGNLQWKKYPNDTVTTVSLEEIYQTSDSGFVILGYETPKTFLLKIDKDGNLKWKKQYPDTALDGRLYRISPTNDNGFIMCGHYTVYSPVRTYGYLVKTDSTGIVQWQRGYIDSTQTLFGDVIQFPDSCYYVTETTYIATNYPYSYVKKISPTGNLIWSKYLQYRSGGSYISKTSDTCFAVLSDTYFYNKEYINYMDTSGYTIWQSIDSFPAFVYSVTSEYNKSIVLTGFDPLGSTIGVNKLSLSGSGSFFKKSFLHTGYSQIGLQETRNTSDRGFIMIGGATTNNKYHILVIKADSSFNAPPITGVYNPNSFVSNEFLIHSNYPNPFNASTVIKFSIPENGFVGFKLFDITGKEILILNRRYYQKGLNNLILDVSKYNLSSGVYFYSIEYKGQIRNNKLVFLK
jgi:hypothetical protein